MNTEQPKRIPYGMQNWEAVRLDNFYYVDKTRYIAEIEASNSYFFFIHRLILIWRGMELAVAEELTH